jgi:putative flippase GtrA
MDDIWERLFRLYEKIPQALRNKLGVFVSSPQTLRLFVVYIGIGFAGLAAYFAVLEALLRENVPLLAATACSFLVGVSFQFLLNRYVNFRAFDRAVTRQASTYVVVIGLNLLLTMLVVAVAVRALHMNPFLANLATIPITSPVAYLANRYLTFGPGIRARLRDWLRVRRESL